MIALGSWSVATDAAPIDQKRTPTSKRSEQNTPRHATPDDVHVFDPYIGRFESKQFRDEESGETFHYIAQYSQPAVSHMLQTARKLLQDDQEFRRAVETFTASTPTTHVATPNS